MPFCREIVEMYAKKLDLSVVATAVDGKDALDKYIDMSEKGKQPNLVTMDVDMPNMNGKDSVRYIREYEKKMCLEPANIIMISGNCSNSEISKCLDPDGDIKADDFLKKPLMISELKTSLVKLASFEK